MAKLKRDRIKFEAKEDWLAARCQDLTSTEVSALFGCCPYFTEFELWHNKMSQTWVEIDDNERMFWGRELEEPIAKAVAKREGWNIRKFKTYVRIPSLRLGASFDYRILGDPKANFEIKNVDWLQAKQKWIFEKDWVEAPPHIEFQVQHQLLVSGLKEARIACLVGGNDVRVVTRYANEKVHDAIKAKAAAFWASVDSGEEPEPDFERDASFIMALNQYAEAGKVVETEDQTIIDMCSQYAKLGKSVGEMSKARDAIKAQLVTKIGDAEKVLMDGFTISAKMTGETVVQSFTKKAYRNFRITAKKKKEQADGK